MFGISFAGYLAGMALVEVVIKPTVVRLSKKGLAWLDGLVFWVPDYLHEEEQEQSR